MLLRLLPNRISWFAASLAVVLGSGACLAQEVGFVDLTQIVARTELRRPAPRSDEATDRRGGDGIVDSRHDDCDVPNAPKDAGALRTLQRGQPAFGMFDDSPRKYHWALVGAISAEG